MTYLHETFQFTVTTRTVAARQFMQKDPHNPYRAHIGAACPGARFWSVRGAGPDQWRSAIVQAHAVNRLCDVLDEWQTVGGLFYEWTWASSETREIDASPAAFAAYGEVRPEAVAAFATDRRRSPEGPSLAALPDEQIWLRPWQVELLRQACLTQRHAAHHPPGGGKTAEGILFLLTALHDQPRRPGRQAVLIFVTTVAAGHQVADEWGNMTDVRAWVYLAASHRRKRSQSFKAYLDQQREAGKPAVLIVGRENTPDVVFCDENQEHPDWNIMLHLTGRSVEVPGIVLDEIHRFKNHSRFDAHVDAAGATTFPLKDNQASALHQLLYHKLKPNPPWVLALSATPIYDDLSDLWASLDLVQQYGFGSYYDFCIRYCSGGESQGHFTTGAATNKEELLARLDFVRHMVEEAEVLRFLPPCRQVVIRIPVAAQIANESGHVRELKGLMKAATGGASEAKGQVLALQTALAAERIRPWLVDRACENLRAGRKTIIFTGLRKEVEKIRNQVAQRLGWKSTTPAEVRKFARIDHGNIKIWATYGESHSAAERNVLAKEYNTYEGPALLVGTGDVIGESLNLQNTDELIHGQLPWSPGQVTQRTGRVKARLGRNRPVTVVFPVPLGTVAERIAEILIPKLNVVEDFVSGSGTGELAEALRLDETTVRAEEDDLFASLLGRGTSWAAGEDDD